MMNFFWKSIKIDQKGFTLVELLVVVVILGVLATLAVQTIGSRADVAEKSTNEANARIVASAVELYVADKGTYPTDAAALVPNYLREIPTN
ncbi:MAG: prepilin-type N-terminal cleavage/methylation domain-containing protein, partial [Peptococcales bacterium]